MLVGTAAVSAQACMISRQSVRRCAQSRTLRQVPTGMNRHREGTGQRRLMQDQRQPAQGADAPGENGAARDSRVRASAPRCRPGLELDDEPSPCTASLQTTMSVSRPLRRIDLGHAKRDLTGFDLLAESV